MVKAAPVNKKPLVAVEVAQAPPPNNNNNRLTNLFYLFAAVCFALISMLVKDEMFLRRKLPKRALPWQNTQIDRVLVVALCTVAFLIAALVLERSMLVSRAKLAWRQQRTELISWWKTTYRTRHRIFFQYVVLLAQLAVAACVWRLVILATQCEAPIVVVLSGSMETAFYRGDILFLTNYHDEIDLGEIVVYRIDGRDIPIVHRMLQVHESNNETLYLTKGDNNNGHDRPLYAPGQLWLTRKEVIGRARFFVPYLGMITVKVNEYPLVKFTVIAVMLVLTIYTKEL